MNVTVTELTAAATLFDFFFLLLRSAVSISRYWLCLPLLVNYLRLTRPSHDAVSYTLSLSTPTSPVTSTMSAPTSLKAEPGLEEAFPTKNNGLSTPTEIENHDPFAVLDTLPTSRKILLLTILCLAIFLDTFNNSSLFAAIPPIAQQLDIPDSQSVWLLSAYQLTFAVLLLVSGRVSDLYNPSQCFFLVP